MNTKQNRVMEILRANKNNQIAKRNDERTAVVWCDDPNKWGARTQYPSADWHGVWNEITNREFNELLSNGLIIERAHKYTTKYYVAA